MPITIGSIIKCIFADFEPFMNKTFYILLISTVILTGVTACCKRKLYCSPGSLNLAFVGFQRSDIRSFVLRRYDVKDTVRYKALDSAQFLYSGNAPVNPGKKDTIWISDYTSNGSIGAIYYGNDWTITLSSTRGQFSVTTIYDEEHRSDIVGCNDNQASCVNNIAHFTLNGGWNSGNTGYIVK